MSLAAATRTGPPFEARFDEYPQDHRPVVPTVASGLILTEPFTGTATAGVMLKHAGRGGEAALETAHQARFGRLKTEVGG